MSFVSLRVSLYAAALRCEIADQIHAISFDCVSSTIGNNSCPTSLSVAGFPQILMPLCIEINGCGKLIGLKIGNPIFPRVAAIKMLQLSETAPNLGMMPDRLLCIFASATKLEIAQKSTLVG